VNYKEALKRVDEGEIFKDPTILRLAHSSGWSIAHVQALRGWTTLDPDILSLEERFLPRGVGVGGTVLDVMLRYGWKPETEEEKLVVFTVKAGA